MDIVSFDPRNNPLIEPGQYHSHQFLQEETKTPKSK